MNIKTDIVIIGSGVAALQAARVLSQRFDVHLVTKSELRNGSSYNAQGGIAAVTSEDDHISYHIHDTLIAGEHHHAKQNVETLIVQGKETMKQIINEDFPTDRTPDGSISLGLEGAHSKPRIVHSGGDATGKALVDYLLTKLSEKVHIHPFEFAFELLLNKVGECIGVRTKTKDGENCYFASYVILATGGAGALYSCTSNVSNSFGDGIALAYLAGAEITDMEFIQFHPSLLYINGRSKGLVSEAVRGEGGHFVDENGRKIMQGVHPLGDLAPRHITAYEMYKERAKGNNIYVDISEIDHFDEKFPTITNLCEENGVSISEGRIPIAPGSHFLMGGIVADCYGRTSIPRLHAVGEVACTGVHGANRLASNSLLEGVTFGKLMAENLLSNGTLQQNFHPVNHQKNPFHLNLLSVETLQNKMLEHAGILRSSEGLESLIKQLPSIKTIRNVNTDYLNRTQLELFFMHITATLIANAALTRTESRGAHIRKDYIDSNNYWKKQWIVFSKGSMNVRDYLYEHNQTTRFAKAVL